MPTRRLHLAPPAVAQAKTDARTPAVSGVVPARVVHVLLVDDEPAIHRTYQRALRAWRIVSASSLAEVVTQVETAETPFDVAVVDLDLGRESGIDVHRWLTRELGARAPTVLFLTGGNGTRSDEAYMASSGAKCLMKPIALADLRTAITDAVLDV